MTNRPENRRVRMTKRLMKDALLELLEQKDLVAITVTAVCETADIHRSTFYKYYEDTAALLRDLEQDYLDQIPTPSHVLNQIHQEQLLSETTAFFDYVKRNERAFRVFFGESTSSNFTARLIDLLCSKYAENDMDDEMASYYRHLYIANGTVGMLRDWVKAGFPISSRKIAEMMYFFSVNVAQQNQPHS